MPAANIIVPITNLTMYDHVLFLHFNKSAEFTMTRTEPALCTSAPTTGFKIPVIASTMARKFKAIEKVRLHLMVTIIRLERARR